LEEPSQNVNPGPVPKVIPQEFPDKWDGSDQRLNPGTTQTMHLNRQSRQRRDKAAKKSLISKVTARKEA